VTLPAVIPDQLDVLLKHDEDAEIYINGVLAATASGFNDVYAAIPMSTAARATLKPGIAVIAAHCRNTVGGQGIDIGIAQHAPATHP
jgi:nickel-dependent lactate racemase